MPTLALARLDARRATRCLGSAAPVAAAFSLLLALASPAARGQTTVTLDGTSGSNSISTSYTLSGDTTLDLGFFVDYLVVGGGGGGGNATSSGFEAGGGGAGGVKTGSLNLVSTATTSVTVGSGGASATQGQGSGFGSVSVSGGGAGGSGGSPGGSGASGGGGAHNSTAGGTGIVGEGFAGGGGGISRAGGGGGAGQAGNTGGQGRGGNGLQSSISGTLTFYGGGGAGAVPNTTVAGGQGGGAGTTGVQNSTAAAGTPNTGGGGAGALSSASGAGGAGGSGIVIARYAGAAISGVGGTTSSFVGNGTIGALDVTYQVSTFTSGGTFNLSGVDFAARLGATLIGTLSGSGGLTYSGPGVLTLGAANTFNGTTRATAGTLNLGHAAALQASTLDLAAGDAGTIALTASGPTTYALGGLAGSKDFDLGANALAVGGNGTSTTYSGALSGSGGLTKQGAGTLTLAGENTFTGGTTIAAGRLALGASERLANSGSVSVTGGVFDLGGFSETVGSLSVSDGTVANGTISAESITVTGGGISAVLAGSGSLTKSGAGEARLSGSNTFSGGFTLSGGKLVTGNSSALGSGSVTLAGGDLQLTPGTSISNPILLDAAAASNSIGVALTVDYLVVGGGGGGGNATATAFEAGGGGAGGVKTGSLNLVSTPTTSVTVGSGGASATQGQGSGFGSVSVSGGGAGGSGSGSPGGSGASGGGGAHNSTAGGSGIAGEGFAGGAGGSSRSGGGGGAGEPGNTDGQGFGGDGLESSISGTLTFYGGGGAGVVPNAAIAGGLGGGASTTGVLNSTAAAGTTNTGGGGAGANSNSSGGGGVGGSGIVIVRYFGDPLATGGVISAGTDLATGYTVHTFSSTGTSPFTITVPISSTLSGDITGSGGFTFDTPSTLVLAGSNTYEGETIISAGILQVGGGGETGSLGAGAVVNNSSLVFARSNGVAAANTISGSGSLTQQGAGTLTLSGANTYSGGTTIAAGTLAVAALADSGTSNLGTSGTLTLAGGTLEYTGSTAATTARVVDISAANTTSTIDVSDAAGSLTLTGKVWNTDAAHPNVVLNKTGSGTLEIGGTTSNTRTSLVAAAGTVVLNNSERAVYEIRALDAGATVRLAANQQVFSGDATATTGNIRMTGGTLDLAGHDQTINRLVGADNSTAGTGTITSASPATFTVGSNLTGRPSLFAGTLAGDLALAVKGTNPVTLSGDNTYAGTTTIQDAGTQLRIGAGGTTGSLGLGAVSNAGELVFDRSDALGVVNVISGSGSLTQAGSGTLTLSGANTYSGGTTIAAGTLVGTATSLQGNISNASALVFDDAAGGMFAGVISGAGTVTKSGTGNLVLSGSNSYTGPTAIAAGRLSVNGSLANTAVSVQSGAELGGTGSLAGTVAVAGGGRLSPGNSIGVLTQGDTTFDTGAIFKYEVDSTNLSGLSTAADLLVVNGGLNIAAGTLLEFSDLAAQAKAFVEDSTVFAMINYTGAWNGGLFTYNSQTLTNGSRFFVGSQMWEIDYAYVYDTESPGSTVRPLNFQGSHVPASGTQTFVTVTAVPEPSTCIMALAGLGFAGYSMFRRRKRA